MRPYAPLLLVPVLLLLSAFQGRRAAPAQGPPATAPAEAAPAEAPPEAGAVRHALVARRDVSEAVELPGTYVPADAVELAVSPAAYGGALRFAEVVPHGTYVSSGDVVARFDAEALEDEIEGADQALADAELAHRGTVERGRLAAEAAAAALARTTHRLERARDELAGWRDVELALEERGAALSAQYVQDGIDDATDELRQLEAMYSDDELVEATEEIVLQRSRRDLARDRTSQKLRLDRRAHELAHEIPERTTQKEHAVADAERERAHLVATQALEADGRERELAKSARSLEKARERVEELRADLAAMTLTAPRSGVVLHGGWTDWRPGAKRPDFREGTNAAPRSGLFLVADPDRLDVALAVQPDVLAAARGAPAVRVTSASASEGDGRVGRLAVDAYPAPDGSFLARVTLDGASPGRVAGLGATVRIDAPAAEDVLVLPRAAVHRSGADAWCWVAAGGEDTYRRVPLQVGREHGGDIVVEGDLHEGERVLLAGD